MSETPLDINRDSLKAVLSNIRKVYFGDLQPVRKLLICLLSGGHVLIEDVPGVGKTTLAQALSLSVDCQFNRIQLTPDLLPSDITGVNIYNSHDNKFEFKPGPIFCNIVLADEINRTTPRTQSALLEAMSEQQVSIDGTTHPLPEPFMVLATQNPFEFEGTYFLPENQLDRFMMRIVLGYPDRESELRILAQEPSTNILHKLQPVIKAEEIVHLQKEIPKVEMDDRITDYLMDIVEGTRNHPELLVGASPRAALALQRSAKASAVLANRDYCLPDDVKSFVLPVFSHRIISKKFAHEPTRQNCDHLLEQILKTVATPT